MKMLISFTISMYFLIGQAQPALAQAWMNNYSYRKMISIDKAKVYPTIVTNGSTRYYQDLIDFPVLIDIQDEDLIHNPGSCGNKISDPSGKDISFALSTASANPLSFQMESYDPTNGRLRCWVRIPALSANMSPSAATRIYLYYGSVSALYDSASSSAQQTWSAENIGIWHMNLDGLPPWSGNAKNTISQERVVASAGMTAGNYQTGMLGKAVFLNGSSESLFLKPAIGTNFSISIWINIQNTGREQVILSNDSLYANGLIEGFTLKLNASGNLVMELRRGNLAVYSQTSQAVLEPGVWHYICATTTGYDIFFSIDADKMQGKSGTSLRLGQGGAWRMGSTKQGTGFFKGMIDELRIRQGVKGLEWFQTEFLNQKEPTSFYTCGNEEYVTGQFKKFTGAINNRWDLAGNWSPNTVPADNDNVLIASGKSLRIQGLNKLILNKLVLEPNAILSLGNDLSLRCKTEIAAQAEILLDEAIEVRFMADVRNHGQISVGQNSSKLIFSGVNGIQKYYGKGSAILSTLSNEQSAPTDTLILQSPVSVSGSLKLDKGILNANGMLTLKSGPTGSAAVLPLRDLNQAGILGNVNVEKFIAGNYPAPSTARGWRLLSSSVYHTQSPSIRHYSLNAFKSAMFITGPGGSTNGFDDSPLNGGTIYTHDQSLPGTLSQKYQVIPNTFQTIPLGKGIFVFSRGSRQVPNAYQSQLQVAPFSNPDSYIIIHTGRLHIGALSVFLQNADRSQEGDGFNLLGNPYASDIVWGRLTKNNLNEFVWLFDPINNAYTVTDLPETVIPSGSGFFVRVNRGSSTGMLTFTEDAKSEPVTSFSKAEIYNKTSEVHKSPSSDIDQVHRISVTLSRDSFHQNFILKLRPNGSDELNDHDALKIGEGHLSISSICQGQKLAIEERELRDTGKTSINLHVKGWSHGKYQIRISATNDRLSLKLQDNYLKQIHQATDGKVVYEFEINPEIRETQAEDRFTLTLETTMRETRQDTSQIFVYPNPFREELYIAADGMQMFYVQVRNIQGRLVKTGFVKSGDNVMEGMVKHLQSGIYLVQICNEMTRKNIKTFKVLKN